MRFARATPAAGEEGALSGKISSRTRASISASARSPCAAQRRVEEVERDDRLEVAALLAEHPVDRDRVGDPEPGLERFHRLHELPVLLGAVEQTAGLLRLRLVRALYVQDVDAAVDARHEPGELAETAAVLGRVGQQVGAVAQRRAAQVSSVRSTFIRPAESSVGSWVTKTSQRVPGGSGSWGGVSGGPSVASGLLFAGCRVYPTPARANRAPDRVASKCTRVRELGA